jgi:hypothetical protein
MTSSDLSSLSFRSSFLQQNDSIFYFRRKRADAGTSDGRLERLAGIETDAAGVKRAGDGDPAIEIRDDAVDDGTVLMGASVFHGDDAGAEIEERDIEALPMERAAFVHGKVFDRGDGDPL